MRYWQTRNGTLVERLLWGWSNVYLVSFDGHDIMVDTGPAALSGLLLKRLDAIGLKQLDALVLTHTHFDHTGSVAVLKEKFKMPVIVHRSESGFLESGISPLPHGSILATKFIYNLGAPRVEHWFKVRGVIPDILVDDFMELSSFGLNARLIHTPGHSIGSCSLVIDDQLAVSGDTCVSPIPRRAFPPWADDPISLVRSWKKILDTGCELFLPMHHWTISRKTLEREYERLSKKEFKDVGSR
ncbi:MAG: MBL fold metallo-hydrolase [Bacteroidetes bacterium]|nr:MBL fold metallo-hydrolase [Bacteroidota bacterium]